MVDPRTVGDVWAGTLCRRRWVASFRRRVAGQIEPLASLICRETGKPEWEAVTSDILPLLVACRWLERRGPRLLGPKRLPGSLWTLGTRVTERRTPLGVVAIIATWNYPVQLLGVQLVHALLAGNRVVVKPSERAWQSQGALCRLAIEAGLPGGVLEVYDHSREAGARLLSERRFDHVVFTGSTGVGAEVAKACAETFTPSTLELSGRDSAFVLADADPALAARSVWNAVAMNAGQTCMAPRRVFVERAIAERFERCLTELARCEPERPVISEHEAERVRELVRDAVGRGGRPTAGVGALSGRTLRPVAVFDCPPDAPLAHGAHFGPAVAVVTVDSVEDAMVLHRRCEQHLATSVFTRDRRAAQRLAGRLGSTTVTVNDCVVPVGHPGVSIGGLGQSGWGLSRGEAGLLAMTRPVFETRTSPWLRAPVGEPTPAMRKWLPRAVRRLFGGGAGDGPGLVLTESDQPISANSNITAVTRQPGSAPGSSRVPAHV